MSREREMAGTFMLRRDFCSDAARMGIYNSNGYSRRRDHSHRMENLHALSVRLDGSTNAAKVQNR